MGKQSQEKGETQTMGIWRATSCCGCAPLRIGTLIIGVKGIIFGILFAALAVIMMPNVDGLADAINDLLRMTRQQAAKLVTSIAVLLLITSAVDIIASVCLVHGV